ncbi:hypothetical protein N7539_001925 [Penicillium diatomitis]|uniref:Uncharacterized protein n=1 Tax=Penicillium diatomitis TaxID=2819901 RepID=A0A9X0C0N7_9EURO|nr:uncharacterized protein N7539_001925 [Penicillium diatomitis]KAJ5493179.1 hypothetical protein N7539_001925 [Penicillium diatomitis]
MGGCGCGWKNESSPTAGIDDADKRTSGQVEECVDLPAGGSGDTRGTCGRELFSRTLPVPTTTVWPVPAVLLPVPTAKYRYARLIESSGLTRPVMGATAPSGSTGGTGTASAQGPVVSHARWLLHGAQF